MPFAPTSAPPPKHTIDDAQLIPEATSGIFSRLTFQWITHLLALGYARPLETPDLYKLQDERHAAVVAEKIVQSFQRRLDLANAYNRRLLDGEISPGWRSLWWTLRGNRADREKRWREKDGQKRASLVWAMNDSVAWWFWSAGLCKVTADTSQVLSPLIVKVRHSRKVFV